MKQVICDHAGVVPKCFNTGSGYPCDHCIPHDAIADCEVVGTCCHLPVTETVCCVAVED